MTLREPQGHPEQGRGVTAVYALYPDGASAQQAINRLRASGLTDREITILTAQPMEDYEFGHIDSKSYMWWIACGGGLLGCVGRLVEGHDVEVDPLPLGSGQDAANGGMVDRVEHGGSLASATRATARGPGHPALLDRSEHPWMDECRHRRIRHGPPASMRDRAASIRHMDEHAAT